MRTQAPNHHSNSHRTYQGIIALTIILIATFLLSACSASQGQFDEEGNLDYGDLRVSLLETGFDRVYEGFVCNDEDFQHPFSTLLLTCSDSAEPGCHLTVTLAVKYDNGASWGSTSLNTSSSSTDFQPKTMFLEPGESRETTFRPNSAVRHCWDIREPVKRITVALRDESGELKDMQANYKP
jgi:hypothetical protein